MRCLPPRLRVGVGVEEASGLEGVTPAMDAAEVLVMIFESMMVRFLGERVTNIFLFQMNTCNKI